jgi:peptide/nickel transport system substrate-binding protein
VEVVDEFTVKYILKTPFPPFASYFAGQPRPSLFPVSPTAADELGDEKFRENPVGTGPFKFVEWVKGDRIVLERNDEYFKGKSAFKRVIFRDMKDPAAQRLSLQNKEIDMIYDQFTSIPPSDMEAYSKNPDYTVSVTPRNTYTWLFFWSKDPNRPLGKKNVRQALAYATDRHKVVNAIMQGWAPVPDGWCSDEMWSYEPSLKQYEGFNMEKAKQLLAEEGFGPENRLKLKGGYASMYKVRRDIFLVLKDDWAKVGVDLELTPYEIGVWTSTYPTGVWDVAIAGYSVSWNDPYGWAHFFRSTSRPSPNLSQYSNAEYDKLVTDSIATVVQSEREPIYKEVWEFLTEEVPAIPMYSGQTRYIAWKYVEGIPQSGKDPSAYFRIQNIRKGGSPPTRAIMVGPDFIVASMAIYVIYNTKTLIHRIRGNKK